MKLAYLSFLTLIALPVGADVKTDLTKFLSVKIYAQVQGSRLAFENGGKIASYDVLRSVSSVSDLFGYTIGYKGIFSISYYNIDQNNLVSYTRELRSSLSLGYFWIDIFVQHFKDLGLSSTNDFWGTGTYALIPDTELKHRGGNIYYIHSPKDFSLAAIVDQTARQTKSSGSLIYGISYFRTEFSYFPGFFPENPSGNSINSGAVNSLVPSLGYGYSAVAGSWYAAFMAMAGLGSQQQTYEINNESPAKSSSATVSKLNTVLGAGYNGISNSTGITVRFDILQYTLADVKVTNRQSDIQIFFGKRF